MNHLDEGTIHAWLDGALDAAQSAALETHVTSCPQCADAVAEARGLIAASSRILMALDDDRVNVVPKAPVPGVVPMPSQRRVRRTAPWIGAVAAVLLAAVVLQTSQFSNDRVASLPMPLQSEAPATLADSVRPAAPPPMASRELQQSTASVATEPVARRTQGAVPTAKVGNAVPSTPVAPPSNTRALAAGTQNTEAKAEVGSVAGTAVTSTSSRRPEPTRLADEAIRLRAALVSADAPAPSLELRGRGAMVAVLDSSVAGCYAAPSVMAARDMAAAAPVAAQSERRAAAQSRAAAPAAAPPREFLATTPALRVDTARGRVVRAVPSDSIIGSWRVVGDSLQLELSGGRIFTVARSARVVCP